MGECGCTGMDKRYSFPAPGDSLYVLTLSGHCVNCDSPAGVSIERIDPRHTLYDEYKRGEWTDGELRLEEWPDSFGAAIVCGMRRHEFIKATMRHLVGLSSSELGEHGVIDAVGADVILEEMYEDAQTLPMLITRKEPPDA